MRHFNLIISAAMAVSAICGIGAASAADLPARTYTKAPVIVDPAVNWSGFYIGGDVGWAGARQNDTTTATPAGFGFPSVAWLGLAGFGILPVNYGLNSNGFAGGLYAGYNWQMGRTVLGVEGDFSYLNRNSSATQSLIETFDIPPRTVNGVALQLTASNKWLASVRGRVGYTWDKVLVFVTGGAAFTRTEYSQNLSVVAAPLPNFTFLGVPSSSVGFSQDKLGYSAGVGADWMVAQNWMFRLEYLHYGFGGSTGYLPIVVATCSAAINCNLVARTATLNLDSVRIGLAYKFGGPVGAKY